MTDKPQKIRTPKQNNSLHKYATEVADVLNENGVGVKLFIEEFELDWSMEMVKSIIRAIGKQKFGKTSTKDLTTKELQDCYEEFNRKTAEYGVHLPWPSQESLYLLSAYGAEINARTS